MDEIWDLIESVSEGCLVYSPKQHFYEVSMKLAKGYWRSWPLKIFPFLVQVAILFNGAEQFNYFGRKPSSQHSCEV